MDIYETIREQIRQTAGVTRVASQILNGMRATAPLTSIGTTAPEVKASHEFRLADAWYKYHAKRLKDLNAYLRRNHKAKLDADNRADTADRAAAQIRRREEHAKYDAMARQAWAVRDLD